MTGNIEFVTQLHWLIAFTRIRQVTGVMTQGRGDGKEWVTSFKVSYSMDDYNEAYVTDQYENHKVSSIYCPTD